MSVAPQTVENGAADEPVGACHEDLHVVSSS